MEIIKETSDNIDLLVKQAGDKTNWEARLEAVQELAQYDCQQTRDVITRLALRDRVFKVKEEAFRAAQKLNITKDGKPLFLGKKDIGYKPSDFKKIFLRIKKENNMGNFELAVVKEKFKSTNPEMFDVMSYEKNEKFDKWIQDSYNSISKK